MSKLIELKVFIYGLGSVGIEIAKNTILAGPKSVHVNDGKVCTGRDLGLNYYVTPASVQAGATRAQASIGKLKELNPYVSVEQDESDFTNSRDNLDFLKDYSVVVISEFLPKHHLVALNNYCRTHKIGFILALGYGLAYSIFTDFGDSHICYDDNGEEISSYNVSKIELLEDNKIGVECFAEGITFETGSYVEFSEITGTLQLNKEQYQKNEYDRYQYKIFHVIKAENVNYFVIEQKEGIDYSQYKSGGVVLTAKKPHEFKFKPLEDSFLKPLPEGEYALQVIDLSKFGVSENLHAGFLAILDSLNESGKLKKFNEDHSNLVQDAKKYLETLGEFEWKEEIVQKLIKFADNQCVAIAAIVGGITAQEVVKYTGKYTPVYQWMHADFYEALSPATDEDRVCTPNNRYQDAIELFGNTFVNKLHNLKLFLVGAGALGCEYIKLFALLGIGTNSNGANGLVYVTDNDSIEVSNLNRQFLFRNSDVTHFKSEVACREAKVMNPELNLVPQRYIVSKDTTMIYNDEFWSGLSFVMNAVDNLHAREFIDSKCVNYLKPFVDAGTQGVKSNTQVVLPGSTQSYGDSRDPEEKEFKVCTLKNYPYQVEHTIQWARDEFELNFVQQVQDYNSFVSSKDKFKKDLNGSNMRERILRQQAVYRLYKIQKLDQKAKQKAIVHYARTLFEKYYTQSIRALLNNFPADFADDKGVKFWTAPKMCPSVVEFDSSVPEHIEFVFHTANVYNYILNLPYIEDVQVVKTLADSDFVDHYVDQFGKKFNQKGEEIKEDTDDDYNYNKEIAQQLDNIFDVNTHLNVVSFEKDDDSNHHIDFIHFCSTLRCMNYAIKECTRFRTKMIAGKIIPALATTTAMITGFAMVEAFKLVNEYKFEQYRNTFSSLAINMHIMSEPMPALKFKSTDMDIRFACPSAPVIDPSSKWDQITLQGPMTMRQLNEHFQTTYGFKSVEYTIMTTNLFLTDMEIDDMEWNMTLYEFNKNRKPQEVNGIKYIFFEVLSEKNDDGVLWYLPLCRYVIGDNEN